MPPDLAISYSHEERQGRTPSSNRIHAARLLEACLHGVGKGGMMIAGARSNGFRGQRVCRYRGGPLAGGREGAKAAQETATTHFSASRIRHTILL